MVGVVRATCLRLAPVLLALSGSVPARPSEPLSPAYNALVHRYASGDREGAAAEMAAWPDSRVREEMPALEAFRQGFPARAALMLHSDCAQRARREGRSPQPHESAAVAVAGLLKDEPTQRVFARRWYEVMAGLAMGENRWGEALDWAQRGLAAFPDSGEMLLVVGSMRETAAALTVPRESRALRQALIDPNALETRGRLLPAREVREHLEKAHRALRLATAADPSLADARLRLGRVAWRLGEPAEARSVLEEVLARDPPRDTAFLAHLFLGRVDEDAGRLDEAARSYQAALLVEPQAQSARLALSHVRLRLGDVAAARRDMEATVRDAGRRRKPDAFWLYPWGPSVGVEERLERLRREASW